MKGYTFYLEYETPADKRKGKDSGNVCAVFGDWFYSHGHPMRECISAVYFHRNSATCGSSASAEYLRKNCKRISEAKARQIHPRLFAQLDID